MFWKKTPVTVTTAIGTFTFTKMKQYAVWEGDYCGKQIFFFADEQGPSDHQVDQARNIVANIVDVEHTALQYIAKTDFADEIRLHGPASIESISIDQCADEVGLTFGLQGWPDGTVTVEMKHGIPYDVWGGDWGDWSERFMTDTLPSFWAFSKGMSPLP